MLRAWLVVVTLSIPALVAAGPASAPLAPPGVAPPRGGSSPEPAGIRAAVAVNSPVSWFDGSAGISVYWGFKGRHALRANLAHYQAPSFLIGGLIAVATNGEASGPSRDSFIDASVGYMVFPRRLWSGPLLEAAVMLRKPLDVGGYGAINEYQEDTQIVAGRVLAGWSWLITDETFVSIAVGGSAGIEWGVERTAQALDTLMPHTRPISRTPVSPEGFLRIGRTFEL
jgi:hypothetical protein